MGSKFYHIPIAVVKGFWEISTKASQILKSKKAQTLHSWPKKLYSPPNDLSRKTFLDFLRLHNSYIDTDAPTW
nr:MAG TPA_asm: hypothetical protein [Caudoviricetes sp.]